MSRSIDLGIDYLNYLLEEGPSTRAFGSPPPANTVRPDLFFVGSNISGYGIR